MITVKHKENNEWHSAHIGFQTLDHAKAHSVKEGYTEYKAWKGDDLLCHLFNAVAKPKPAKKEKLKVAVRFVEPEVEEVVEVVEDTKEEE
tara:strand:- start:51 stop:320 length:270 start_codon:yes stop_codon:yes gene_type:complete